MKKVKEKFEIISKDSELNIQLNVVFSIRRYTCSIAIIYKKCQHSYSGYP